MLGHYYGLHGLLRLLSLFLWLLGTIYALLARHAILALVYRVSPSVTTSNPLEVCEGYHHDRDIVQGLSHQTILKDAFNAESTVLVHTDALFVPSRLLLLLTS